MIRFRALIVAFGAFALAACGDGGAGSGGAPPSPPAPVSPPAPPPSPPPPPPPPPGCCTAVQIASGLDNPWSIVFLPDGAALVTERDRLTFRRIAQPGGPSPQLGPAIPLPAALNAIVDGQGGLLDVALDPNFAASRRIFFAYVEREGAAGQPTRLAVARAELANDGQSIANAQRIFRIDTPSTDPRHYSGRLAFLSDGTLLVTAGDRHEDQNTLEAGQGPSPVGAQVATSGFGKIHRINRDGAAPANVAISQPAGAAAGLASEYTRGHRNPQGLVVDAASGRVWATEHGPGGGDELNLIVAGRNYGWPLIGRGSLGGSAPQPQPSNAAYTDPLVFWTPAIAPSGMTLYTGALFPQFAGDLFIAALGGQRIVRIDLDANGAVLGAPIDVLTGQGRLRDVEMGPDGKLYVLTDDNNGRVLRLDPT